MSRYQVVTLSGSWYVIDFERRTYIDSHYDQPARFNSFRNVPDECVSLYKVDWETVNDLPNSDKPELGKRMYLMGPGMEWRISTPVLEIVELEEGEQDDGSGTTAGTGGTGSDA